MGLDGILVVSLEQAVAAPLCTQRLVDAGARVIKIERREGDFARGYDCAAKGESSYFVWLNRGKESVVLDIKDAEDARLLGRIIQRADVFVQNLAPGAAARAGFRSASLRARDPKLITCDITGYGETGPARGLKAYDLLIQCETGLAAITGSPEAPGRVGVSVADIACGINAASAIFRALYERERTGTGREISVSLFDSLAEWMTVPLIHHDYAGSAPDRVGLHHPSIAPYGAFACRGGEAIVIAIQNEREWQAFCGDVLSRPEWVAGARYESNAKRVEHREELDSAIGCILGEMDRTALIARLKVAGIAYGSVNGVGDFSDHPQLRRESVRTRFGDVAIPARPMICNGESRYSESVPLIGEHGETIREEFA